MSDISSPSDRTRSRFSRSPSMDGARSRDRGDGSVLRRFHDCLEMLHELKQFASVSSDEFKERSSGSIARRSKSWESSEASSMRNRSLRKKFMSDGSSNQRRPWQKARAFQNKSRFVQNRYGKRQPWDTEEEEETENWERRSRLSMQPSWFEIRSPKARQGLHVQWEDPHSPMRQEFRQNDIHQNGRGSAPQQHQRLSPSDSVKNDRVEAKSNLELAKLQEEVNRLQEELQKARKPPPDVVAIPKRRLTGLIEEKEIKAAGGVENAIAGLVKKGREMESQLAQLKDELRKRNEIEEKLDRVKSELQGNLQRIERHREVSPNQGSKSEDAIEQLSRRIAAIEQQQEMLRFSVTNRAPIYYQNPSAAPARHQPVVHQQALQQSCPAVSSSFKRPLQQADQWIRSPARHNEPTGIPSSSYEPSGELSIPEGSDIAELYSALAATVDLVKKVVDTDA